MLPLDGRAAPPGRRPYRISTAVLRTHEANSFPGGLIASLSVPWGASKGDGDLGGYHLVWPRDLVEAAGGLFAAGATADAVRVLHYLAATQEADGHWPQNCWLDGTPYWNGTQMDECALPILLVGLALREGCLSAVEVRRFWPMVRRAAGFIARNGPVTGQDRWEEDGGYTPFTLAAEIAALLIAADLAEGAEEAAYLRDTADLWNDLIERWIYVTDTPLVREFGVAGYYVRVTPPQTADAASPLTGFVPIKNRAPGDGTRQPAAAVVSPDVLALVRFGLRAPDDPRILDTLKVIDALLRVELPAGPCWRRYNGDGYGEHADGASFDGVGTGRAWPLLTGERAHYALAAGDSAGAERLLVAMEGFASDEGLLPEQVWDAEDVPARKLFRGHPSGSAMPLVWAHAEHVKLLRSLRDGRVFDTPSQSVQRYLVDKVRPRLGGTWRPNNKCRAARGDLPLRVELPAPATVHWSDDGWHSLQNTPTHDSGFGTHVADLRAAAATEEVIFTFRWTGTGLWEGEDYRVSMLD
ncbi:glycoside hydrolase family 15 protein [Siccirubricoccus sp. G192]|uniref:glycoside hydrolase family 15 protein n=1 Tax=Siccirubricoccus sp. G192 TaxID=2849651 RepID=UPI0035C7C4DC